MYRLHGTQENNIAIHLIYFNLHPFYDHLFGEFLGTEFHSNKWVQNVNHITLVVIYILFHKELNIY